MAFETFVAVVVRHLRRPVDVVVDPEMQPQHLPQLAVVVAAAVDDDDAMLQRAVAQLPPD